ncbi:MAG: NADP-dependent oxidoreductase [Pseudomonadota bacterium]
MTATTSRDWTLKTRPVGEPKASDFELVERDVPAPADGQIQVKNSWMSVDPYMRGRMMDRESYVPPFQLGESLQGGAIGQVVASNHPDYAVGDKVNSMLGWREAWTAPPEAALTQKLPAVNLPDEAFLGVVGMPGLTAYAGLLRVGELKEGETVFVSGAAGAVGSTVCQIAKIKNCTVVGSAGGPEKVAYLKSIGVDHAIDYKAVGGYDGLVGALAEAAPKGIDVYFDNVGGDHLQAAIELARPMGRLALCGMIEQYNATEPRPGPHNMIMAVGKQLKLQGFIVSTHIDMQPDFVRDMSEWIGSGKLKYEQTVMDGIEKAPEAFMGLFSGANTGKMLVKIG